MGAAWNRGKKGLQHHSVETRHKMSLRMMGNQINKGRQHTEEQKRKIAAWSTGRTHTVSQEARMKVSLANRGNQWNIGKTLSEERKHKISLAHMGKIRTLESRIKQSLTTKGRKRKPESIAKGKEKRKFQILPFRDSKPERMFQLALELNQIQFEKHRVFKINDSYHQVDLFINPNICVEIDGCYWHACLKCAKKELNKFQIKAQQRDMEINHSLNLQGFHVIRLWEHDIVKGDRSTMDNVINMIKVKTNELSVK